MNQHHKTIPRPLRNLCLYVCTFVSMHVYSVCLYREGERDREEETDAQHTPSPVFPSLAALAAFLAAIAAFLCAANKKAGTRRRAQTETGCDRNRDTRTHTNTRRFSVKPARDPLAPQVCLPTRQSRLQGCAPTRALLPYTADTAQTPTPKIGVQGLGFNTADAAQTPTPNAQN